MLTWIIIVALILSALFGLTLCRISGRDSRREEADEARRELAQ
jgi:hypothetical protein